MENTYNAPKTYPLSINVILTSFSREYNLTFPKEDIHLDEENSEWGCTYSSLPQTIGRDTFTLRIHIEEKNDVNMVTVKHQRDNVTHIIMAVYLWSRRGIKEFVWEGV